MCHPFLQVWLNLPLVDEETPRLRLQSHQAHDALGGTDHNLVALSGHDIIRYHKLMRNGARHLTARLLAIHKDSRLAKRTLQKEGYSLFLPFLRHIHTLPEPDFLIRRHRSWQRHIVIVMGGVTNGILPFSRQFYRFLRQSRKPPQQKKRNNQKQLSHN